MDRCMCVHGSFLRFAWAGGWAEVWWVGRTYAPQPFLVEAHTTKDTRPKTEDQFPRIILDHVGSCWVMLDHFG